MYDLEMIKEMGFCRGIENYSRHLTGKPPVRRRRRCSIICTKIRLSSLTNRTRRFRKSARCIKATVREKGIWSNTVFVCRRAMDNRPLNFEEFEERRGQTIYVSATPGNFELEKTGGEVVEQIIRPTGLA